MAVESWDYCKNTPEAWLINASIFIAAKRHMSLRPQSFVAPDPPQSPGTASVFRPSAASAEQ